jgi:hypothetical protein
MFIRMVGSLRICTLSQYCAGDKIENVIGGLRSADGEETGVYRVVVGKPEGERPWQDLDLDGRV